MMIAGFSVAEETLNLTINKRERNSSLLCDEYWQEQMLLLFVLTFCEGNHQQKESLMFPLDSFPRIPEQCGPAGLSWRATTFFLRNNPPLTPVQRRGRAKWRCVLRLSARNPLALLAVSNSNPRSYPENLVRRERFNHPRFSPSNGVKAVALFCHPSPSAS